MCRYHPMWSRPAGDIYRDRREPPLDEPEDPAHDLRYCRRHRARYDPAEGCAQCEDEAVLRPEWETYP